MMRYSFITISVLMMAMVIVGVPHPEDECRGRCALSRYCDGFLAVCRDCLVACPAVETCRIQRCKEYLENLKTTTPWPEPTQSTAEAQQTEGHQSGPHIDNISIAATAYDDENDELGDPNDEQVNHATVIMESNNTSENAQVKETMHCNNLSMSTSDCQHELFRDVDDDNANGASFGKKNRKERKEEKNYLTATVGAAIIALFVAGVGAYFAFCHVTGCASKGILEKRAQLNKLARSSSGLLVVNVEGEDSYQYK